MRKDIFMDLLQTSSGLLPTMFFLYMVSCCFLIPKDFIFRFPRYWTLFLGLAFCFAFVSVRSSTFNDSIWPRRKITVEWSTVLKVCVTQRVFLSFQPSRQQPSVVPHSTQSHKALGLQPVQVAVHQDCHCSPGAGHAGSFPLQHAWLHGQENAGSLRCCSDTSAEGSSNFTNQMASNPLSALTFCPSICFHSGLS